MDTKIVADKILKQQPDFIKDTPLDNFFQDLDNILFTPLVEFQEFTAFNDVSIYAYLNFKNNNDFVTALLKYLDKLHALVLNNQKIIRNANSNLLPISLYDMKYVDSLLNLIIIHGIDGNMPSDCRISLDSKRLTHFKKEDKRFEIPKDHVFNIDTLVSVINKFYDILVAKSDDPNDPDYLRSIILKGPTYTNIFLGVLTLILKDETEYEKILKEIESLQETYSLFQMYTLLTQTITNSMIKKRVINLLSILPIRREDDGLMSLVDFILGVRENEDIDIEKMSRINQILLSKPPNDISNAVYLQKIFKQIYDALTFINRPILISCINSVVKDFFLRNKRIVRDFLFKKIYQILFNSPTKAHSSKDLNDMINVLISLSKNSSIDLVYDLVYGLDGQQFFQNLWIYALFLKQNQKLDPIVANNLRKDNVGPYYEVILSLMKSFLFILNKYDVLEYLSLNLLNSSHENWEYCIDLETQLPFISITDKQNVTINDMAIKKEHLGDSMNAMSKIFHDMDVSVELFIQFLILNDNEDSTKNLFLTVLKRWVKKTSYMNPNDKKTLTDDLDLQSNNLMILLDMKLLEKMNKDLKSDLIKNINDILNVISDMLGYATKTQNNDNEIELADSDDDRDGDSDSDDEDDSNTNDDSAAPLFDIVLQLLESVLEESPVNQLLNNKAALKSIRKKLLIINTTKTRKLQSEIDDILNNIIRSENSNLTDSNDVEAQDHEKLDKALRNLADPLVPIKVHGIKELLGLVETRSNVISVDRVIKLYLQYIRNPDPFIFLNVIKSLSLLCQTERDSTLIKLIEFYQNKKKKNGLDDVLKVGEVFINYVQQENELFQGKYADLIIDICLEKVREHNNLDNRIRMSAMSILGICLQVNAKGISNRIGEMLDCVFGILQLEIDNVSKKDDTFIMRRSAVHLIYDLIYNSGLSLLPEKYNIDQLRTLLEYLRGNEKDFLVCEQIEQVLNLMVE